MSRGFSGDWIYLACTTLARRTNGEMTLVEGISRGEMRLGVRRRTVYIQQPVLVTRSEANREYRVA